MRSPLVRRVLVAGAAAVAGTAFGADCAAPSALLERFIAADCERCWQAGAPAPRGRTLVLDWITPAADDAPLATAALPEAGARAAQSPGAGTLLRNAPLRGKGALRMRIADGPAWNGYIGLRLIVANGRRLPRDAVAYVALVERVPAGSDGTPIDRQLVRAVAGPLGLSELATEARIEHLRSMRVPDTARPDRLSSVAWIEGGNGRVIAAVQALPARCGSRLR